MDFILGKCTYRKENQLTIVEWTLVSVCVYVYMFVHVFISLKAK